MSQQAIMNRYIVMNSPKPKEKWRLKSDKLKILTVSWCNECGYVQFYAPWMKRCQDVFGTAKPHILTGAALDTFYKRYERCPTIDNSQKEV